MPFRVEVDAPLIFTFPWSTAPELTCRLSLSKLVLVVEPSLRSTLWREYLLKYFQG